MSSLWPLFDDTDSLNLNTGSNYSPRNGRRPSREAKVSGKPFSREDQLSRCLLGSRLLSARRNLLAAQPPDAAVWTEAPAGRPSSGCGFAEDGGARAAAAARRPRLLFALSAPGRPHPPRPAPTGRADGRGEGGLAEVLRGAVGARSVR